MRHETYKLDIKSSVATGEPQRCADLTAKWVQFSGSGWNATVKVLGSMDGVVWTQLGSNVTAEGFVEVPANVQQLKLDTTAYTAGDLKATLGGHNVRVLG